MDLNNKSEKYLKVFGIFKKISVLFFLLMFFQQCGSGKMNPVKLLGNWFPVPSFKILQVPLYAQQTNMWCWAAGGEMIMDFLGPDVLQCKQANDRFGYANCCNSPTPAQCVKGGWPNYSLYGYTFSSTAWGTALTWAQLKAQIDANKPVGFSWGWSGGGGHYMDATGYMSFGSSKFVLKNDPWPWNANKNAGGQKSWITYSVFVSQAGNHVHWKDDYNITKK